MSLSFDIIREDFDAEDSSTWEWIPSIETSGKDSYNAHDNFWSNNIRNAVCECLYLQLAYGGDDMKTAKPKDRGAQRAPRLYLDASTKVSTGFSTLSTGTLDGKICISNKIRFARRRKEFGVQENFSDFTQHYKGSKFSVAFVDSCSAWVTLEGGMDKLLSKMRDKSILVIEVTTRVGGAAARIPAKETVMENTYKGLTEKLAKAGFKWKEVWGEQVRGSMHCIALRLLRTGGSRPKKNGWLNADLPWQHSVHGHSDPLSYYFNHWLIRPRIPDRMWNEFVLKMPEKAGKKYSIDLVSRVAKQVVIDEKLLQGVTDQVLKRLDTTPSVAKKKRKRSASSREKASVRTYLGSNYVFLNPETLPGRIQDIPTENMTVLNEVYIGYRDYANQRGEEPYSKNIFGKELKLVCEGQGFELWSFYSKRKDRPDGNTRRIVNMSKKIKK